MSIILRDRIDIDDLDFTPEQLAPFILEMFLINNDISNYFLDDLRTAPDDFHEFETAEILLAVLKIFPKDEEINILSIDHDLGEGVMDGYDFVKALCALDHIPPIKEIRLHTDNMVGFKNMYYYLTNAQQHGILDSNIKIDKRKWEVIDGVARPLYTPIGNG